MKLHLTIILNSFQSLTDRSTLARFMHTSELRSSFDGPGTWPMTINYFLYFNQRWIWDLTIWFICVVRFCRSCIFEMLIMSPIGPNVSATLVPMVFTRSWGPKHDFSVAGVSSPVKVTSSSTHVCSKARSGECWPSLIPCHEMHFRTNNSGRGFTTTYLSMEVFFLKWPKSKCLEFVRT